MSNVSATCKADLVAKWRRELAECGILTAPEAIVEIDPARFL